MIDCHLYNPDLFQLGDEPWGWLGRVVAQVIIIVFKAVALWYERRMLIT